jgi:DNA polymerase III epsilon subunit-like protein
VPVEEAHHALDDAFMTAELFLVAAAGLERRGSRSIRDLLRITARG